MRQINTYHFDKNNNFGDMLNVVLLRELFNVNPKLTPPEKCELVCIGSLLESFLYAGPGYKRIIKKALYPSTTVWGTGFIAPEKTRVIRKSSDKEVFYKKMNFSAVRGSLTRDRIEAITGKNMSSLTLGDPGLLSSKLIKKQKTEKKYRVGIIPHYADANNQAIDKILNNLSDSIIIDVLHDPHLFISKISQCETIISSAMHGLIAADSLGIPNKRIVFSNNITGGDYKFNDYYSAFQLKNLDYFDYRKTNDFRLNHSDLKSDYPIKKQQVKQINERLIKAFSAFLNK